jgi:alpha-1,6-mannosyltransferase
MLTKNLKNKLKSQTLLVPLATALSIIFCIALSIGGITGYLDSLAVGKFRSDIFNGITVPRLLATIATIFLSVLYLFWLAKNRPTSRTLLENLKVAAPFLAIAFATYPLSSDIYLYLQYGYMAIEGINPYLVNSFDTASPLHPFIYWHQTSTYGPVSMLFFMASALTVPISPILGIYVFKVFCLLFHILNSGLIWRYLAPVQNRSKITLAYLINPVLLISHIADAHVDVFLCTTIILLIGCLYHRQAIGAVLAVFIGFLTKTLPIVWAPLVIGFLIRKRRWKAVAIAISICLLAAILLSHTVFPTLAAWKSLVNPGVSGQTARSIHHFINLFSVFFTNANVEIWDLKAWAALTAKVSRVTFLCFAGYYLWVLLQPYFRRNYSELNLVVDIGWVTLVLLLIATPWFMPWYPSVLMPIAFLSVDAPGLLLTSLTLGLFANFVPGPASGKTLISLFASLMTIAPAALTIVLRKRLAPWVPRQLVTEQPPPLSHKMAAPISAR